MASYWDLLPPEVQSLILREKYTLEAEDTRPIFQKVLLELLEYSFACKWDNRRSYMDLCVIQRRRGSAHSFSVLRSTPFTCCICGEAIQECFYPGSWGYMDTIYTCHTINGKYNCCYFLDKIIDSIDSNEEIKELPVHPSSYNYDCYDMDDEYIQKKITRLREDVHYGDLMESLMKLRGVECKYKPLRRVPKNKLFR